MPPHSEIFKELSYVFIAAILGGALAWRLKQPLILGYVLAGICISPYTLVRVSPRRIPFRSSPKWVSSS